MASNQEIEGVVPQPSTCTHNKLMRLYDPFSCEQCSVCHVIPAWGWLYHCMYDPTGRLVDLDFVNLELELRMYGILDTRPRRSGSGRVFALNIDAYPEYISFNPGTMVSASTTPGTIATQPNPFLSPEQNAANAKNNTVIYAKPPRSLFACDFKICPFCCPVFLAARNQTLPSIMAPTPLHTPQQEADNRPVPDARALMQHDYNRNHRFYAQFSPDMIGEAPSPAPSNPYNYDESTSKSSSPFSTSRTKLTSSRRTEQAGTSHDGEGNHSPRIAPSNVASGTGSLYVVAQGQKAVIDLDEDNREKRAGRRLSKGRFFIE